MEFPWSQLLGRLHPLAVHFPIALLIVAGLVELLRPRRGRPSDAGLVCLVFGSLGALFAAWSGWEHAEHERVGRALETLLWQHRWVGVATAGVATLTTLLALVQRRSEGGWTGTLYRLGLVLSVLLVSLGGHLGGSLVYGEDYLLELLRDPNRAERGARTEEPGIQARAGDPGVDEFGTAIELSPGTGAGLAPETGTGRSPERSTVPEPAPPTVAVEGGVAPDTGPDPEPEPSREPEPETDPPAPVVEATGPVDFASQIAPLLERSCYECHGPTGRAKAGLRLSNLAAVFEGDPEFWVIVPGHADASLLVELITLPADDLDVMPPDGPLPAADIALLRRWIDEGANYPGKDAAAPATAPGDAPVPPETVPADGASPVEETPPVGETGRAEGTPTGKAPELVLTDEQRAARDAALARLAERGVYASRLSRVSEGVEVAFGLLGREIEDEDLALLAGLEPALLSLDLSRTSVTAAGVAKLAAFPHLVRLRLDHTALGDEALARAGAWKELTYLNLVATGVTDRGLESLRGLRALRHLYVWRTEVTELGAASLAELLPGLEVVRGDDPPAPEEAATEEVAEEVAEETAELHAACCDDAAARGETCAHPCCVAAAAKGEVCPTCAKP